MKKNQHPQYQDVLFVDSASGKKFVCGTTATSDQTEMFEGKELPVIVVPISAASHPFFVGGKQFVDTEGRVERFQKRYQKAAQKKEVAPEQKPEAPKKPRRKASSKVTTIAKAKPEAKAEPESKPAAKAEKKPAAKKAKKAPSKSAKSTIKAE